MIHEFIGFETVCVITDCGKNKLISLMVIKKFPLPVKAQGGRISWVKAEVDEWVNKNNKNNFMPREEQLTKYSKRDKKRRLH